MVWHGDILFDYGFVTLLALYPLRKLSAKTLLVSGTALGRARPSCDGRSHQAPSFDRLIRRTFERRAHHARSTTIETWNSQSSFRSTMKHRACIG